MDAPSRDELRALIRDRISHDSALLDELRRQVRILKGKVVQIQPRRAHSVSVVATDGGDSKFRFDPFLIQVVRVVDSGDNTHSVDVVSPATNPNSLLKRHFDSSGSPTSPLGRMMQKLHVKTLDELSSMIPSEVEMDKPSTGWVSVFRELQEWAVLLDLASQYAWGSETMLIFDGLLRTKKFEGVLFRDYRRLLEQAILRHKEERHQKIYVVGFSKDNQVLTRYRLALTLENVLVKGPAFLEVPRELELQTYKWKEWARGDDIARDDEEVNKFVGGKLFFAKFGEQSTDPIWAVDIMQHQTSEAQTIMGCLLNDTINGFPIPHYPRSLQIAYENAAMVGFDMDLLRHEVFEGIRSAISGSSEILDAMRLQEEISN